MSVDVGIDLGVVVGGVLPKRGIKAAWAGEKVEAGWVEYGVERAKIERPETQWSIRKTNGIKAD